MTEPLKSVELQHIWPRMEAGTASGSADTSLHFEPGFLVTLGVVSIATNKVLGVVYVPLVVRSQRIRHEIQDEVHNSLSEFPPGDGETLGQTEMFINDVTPGTIRRSHIVLRTKIGKGSLEIIKQVFVLVGNRDACRTSFPNAHQPQRIESEFGDDVPIRRRHAA